MKETLERYKSQIAASLAALILTATHISALPGSYDLGGHISRIYILIQDGFGWTDMWYNGHVLFGVYPPLYHTTMAPAGLISFDLIRPLSFGLLGLVAFYSMYYYTNRKLSRDRAIASGLLFISGWLLYIVHISGSMPQAFAVALAPAFYAELEETLEGKNPALAGLLGGGIVLFHHNAAIAIAVGAAALIALNWQKNIFNALSAGVLTFLIASVWLFPAAFAHYPDATFSLLTDIADRGMEDVVIVMPLFGAMVTVKLLGSIDALREHKQEAALGLTGLLLSTGYVAPVIEHVPVIAHLPLYRFYALTAFAAAFLTAAARKEILVVVLALSLALSGAALQHQDFAGFQPGQEEAYEYVAEQDVDLVYDAEDRSLRAYAILIHNQDIADGWSIGSTPIRPGLMKFQEWNRVGNDSPVEFLQRWSADLVITYRNNDLNANLHDNLNESEVYSLDRCFEQTCIFRFEDPLNAVLEKEGNTYIVNASKELPIPYSSRFNGSTYKTQDGFVGVEGSGPTTISYQPGLVPKIAALISALSLLGIAMIYRRDLKVPQSYSKSFRNKLGLCAE